jgi:transposase-like protein
MDNGTTVESVLRSAPEVLGEVMPGLERRRRWSTEEKVRILAQSVAPGSSREHPVNTAAFTSALNSSGV